MRRRTLGVGAISLVAISLAFLAAPAHAVKDEPLVLVTAWYWEDQNRQRIQDPTTGTDVAVISVPNPFCPSPPLAGSPPEQTCKPGRLPIQVREADYETPNQLSAVGFDLALVPPGSEIDRFTVTFLEAKDEQSEPVNAQGKSLQACFVEEFFGDGEAALYKEAPKYTCSDTDPVAPRREIKTKSGGAEPSPSPSASPSPGGGQEEPTYGYTFDLTELARRWLEEATPMTAVMLTPVRPKEADYDPATDANWRTVLVGNVQEGGIKTSLTYTPPKTPETAPPVVTPPTDTGTAFDPGSSVTTTAGDDFGTTDSSGSDFGTTGEDAAEPTDLGEVAAEPAAATLPKGWPGYVWLAILAGIVGLSMVRSVVLEKAAGIRPDGVLAHIRRLNASRRGVDATAVETAATAGGFGAVVAGLKSLGERSGGILDKLNFRKKGS